MRSFTPPVIASIAGSDSSAGAGVQGDIKTAAAMGAWCHTAITAVTAQTPLGVSSCANLPVLEVMAQLQALFTLGPEFAPQALKTGMLGDTDLVPVLAEFLAAKDLPLVVDTVLVATSGARLADVSMPEIIAENLFPLASVITPNLPEAAALLSCEPARSVDEMRKQAERLLQKGASAVLLKGGHLEAAEVVDVLATSAGLSEFRSPKISTRHTHGSGCALSTAIAVGLAQGLELRAAVEQASAYVREFIQRASCYHFVDTNGPLVHLKLQDKRELS